MTNTSVPTARSTDPATSHAAAAKAAKSMPRIRKEVLRIVSDRGLCIGSEINEYYVADDTTKKAAWDSPRKRAGELARDGYLRIIGTRNGESEYVVTYSGFVYLQANA